MSVKRIAKLLDTIERQHGIALRSQRRHSWRPGTCTGNLDLERSHRATDKLCEATAELRKILGIEDAAD